jgi:hypothetical protein
MYYADSAGFETIEFLCYFQCSLERHPMAVSTSQWKGGPLRIDPLATVQVSPKEHSHVVY